MDPPKLYNGCEVTSLAMILNYSGYSVTKTELANEVKRVPLQYENGLKGNPNDGFVGDMENGPGLSVYHGPIYDLAHSYAGNKAVDLTGSEPGKIYEQLESRQTGLGHHHCTFHPSQRYGNMEYTVRQSRCDVQRSQCCRDRL